MRSTSPELSLDLKPTYTPKTITVFLKEISMVGNVSERLCKLNDYIMRLEEEMKKIDAFKRELPLCMLLLNDSILKLKEEIVHFSRSSSDDVQPAVMEEFIPIMRNSDDETSGVKKEKDCRDKMNWMSSAQLWSSNDFSKISDQKQKSVDVKERAEEDDLSATPETTFPVCKYKNGGGGFLPFSGLSGFPVAMTTKTRKEETEVQQTPSLSLSTPGGLKTTNSEQNSGILNSKTSGGCRNHPSVSTSNVQSNLQTGTQSQQLPRKQRRCWSPDLHRRFVSALQQLGGSQVATPKQIRELMKVDGLTNDEVKSHLQKYRLHTRRVPTGSSTTTANQQPVVVLGGLWLSSQDQYGTSKSSTSQSESPQGPLQLAGGGGVISTTGGDSMEDEEDGRSESYSWKGHLHKTGETDPID